ncbi:unnamed protein product [Lepeophtheirus salmonis]|uniref:(salmon louse) hypothetical protein n=1 Tax=Lepeophtheirus salmonis TaxID=72036 RepID=A0A7R8GZL3_LEPSM|nr:unnamed protein product [Lepeophtheirus salmonis]CAF2754638.1 unnamed protein product [Lepeophtheirus salmonis]
MSKSKVILEEKLEDIMKVVMRIKGIIMEYSGALLAIYHRSKISTEISRDIDISRHNVYQTFQMDNTNERIRPHLRLADESVDAAKSTIDDKEGSHDKETLT